MFTVDRVIISFFAARLWSFNDRLTDRQSTEGGREGAKIPLSAIPSDATRDHVNEGGRKEFIDVSRNARQPAHPATTFLYQFEIIKLACFHFAVAVRIDGESNRRPRR